MAFQAAPIDIFPFFYYNQLFAKPVISTGTTPAAGGWQPAPKPSAVNQPPPAVFTGP